jgi:ADP-L-glycero-D-manno-heptose 6-epimerase
VVDRLRSSGKWRNLAAHPPARLVHPDHLRDFLDSHPPLEMVFHLGAISATTATDGDLVWAVNVELPQMLWRWCAARGVRLVYASSAATYGDGTRGMDDTTPDLAQFRPLNLYGYSKHLFDLYAMREDILGDIVGIKYFNVFGPNEYHKGDMRSLVCKAFDQIQETGKIRLFKSHQPGYSDGGQMRDFVYVKDAVEMTLHLAENEDAGGLYNVGSGVARTWNDLAGALFSALGKEPHIEYIDMPESIRHQYQYHTCADISKLRSTGYAKPTTPLEDAVADYVLHHLLPAKRLGE